MRDVLLASMPSSGSDWLAKCFVDAHPHHTYWREFFSPLANWQHSAALEESLGDVLVGCADNLGRSMDHDDLHQLLAETWDMVPASFTKDVMLAAQLDAFAARFDTFILLRRLEDSFPPTRRRVIRWYECFAWQLDQTNPRLRRGSPAERACIGYRAMLDIMNRQAYDNNIPVLWWHDLQEKPYSWIRNVLSRITAVSYPDLMATLICNTRDSVPRPLDHMPQWSEALDRYQTTIACR